MEHGNLIRPVRAGEKSRQPSFIGRRKFSTRPSCVGCDEKRLRRESEAGLCPAHRHRLKQPAPQWVEALATSERDDRAAVSERVPHRLPDSRGYRTGCDVQTVVPVFTYRAPMARCYRSAAAAVHSLPHFIRERLHTLPQTRQCPWECRRARRWRVSRLVAASAWTGRVPVTGPHRRRSSAAGRASGLTEASAGLLVEGRETRGAPRLSAAGGSERHRL